jgi:hypothetical protein
VWPRRARGGDRADGDDCDWVGAPPFVAGTSHYSRGEFIYSDYVHDDAGANVDGLTANNPDPPQPVTGVHVDPSDPTNPDIGGAGDDGDRFQYSGDFGYPMSAPREYMDDADVLEFREAIDGGQLHFLVRLGAMSAADGTVVGIGIDSDRNHATGAGAWPLGAHMPQQLGYDYFVTLWGTGGEITDYTGRTPRATPIHVVANTAARPPFMEADVPLPRGLRLGTWRTYVGAGIWDAAHRAWAHPDPSPQQTAAPGALAGAPYIYNLLFRPYESNSWWHETTQANDLARHDIAEDHADVDASLLADGASTPPPRPTGLLNVQYRTLPLGSGEGVEGAPATDVWRGPIEPYSLVLPSDYYSRLHPRRFMFFFHCAFCQQNVWPFGVEHYATHGQNNLTDGPLGTQHIQDVVDANDMIVAGSAQRGYTSAAPYGDFPGAAERDLRDVEATIRGRDHYAIDPNRVIFSGMSMGGATTQTMMTLYPDELAAAVAHDSAGTSPVDSIARVENIRDVPYTQITGDTGLDSFATTAGRHTAQTLDGLGYRQMYVEYLGRAHDFGLVYDSLPILEGTAYREVRDPNPARVTYTLDASSEDPKLGLVHDHAYWTSGLKLPAGAASGTLDAIALPLAAKLPKFMSHLTGHFTRASTADAAYVDWQVWDRDLTGHGLEDYDPRWSPAPDVAVTNTKLAPPAHAGANGFSLTTSYAAQTLDLDRMSVDAANAIAGWIDTTRATSLTLTAASLGGTRTVTIDGVTATATRSGGALTVQVPPGSHVLVVR